ncbi:MAG: TIGR00303 family protein [Methanobacteriaceae archaeon]|nr:TIGR00303 family protein [Methanobacteriaceae archaeon]
MVKAVKSFGSPDMLSRLQDKDSLFLCVIASTLTSRIPEITGAGASPELTDYTPAADVELIIHGEPKCLQNIPQTVVEGQAAPTPAVITKASLQMADIPFLVADAGSAIKPDIPYVKINDEPGQNILTGKAVENPLEIYKKGKILGETLSQLTDHLIIGESTPAGTTTALGVLEAMGYDAWGKVSGSTPENPHTLKRQTVEKGLESAGFMDEIPLDPFQAVEAVGDPMIPAVAGITAGSTVPVTLAGGTQMTAVCAFLKEAIDGFNFEDVSIATTIFVAKDETSDINYLARQIAPLNIFAVDPGFEKSDNPGLVNYTKGVVKEGVGAGGAMLAAILKGISVEDIRLKTEELCREIF